MRLLFRQRMFSWFDSYDIYDEAGNPVYRVEGRLSWGHKLEIYDAEGRHLATLREKVLTFLPRFEIEIMGVSFGWVRKEFTFLHPRFTLDFKGWNVEGSFLEWDYAITGADGAPVASISKELLHWTDTYVIDVARDEDALPALLVVLAIDAEKCSRS